MNKCIGDDTKAAARKLPLVRARQSLNCIKTKNK